MRLGITLVLLVATTGAAEAKSASTIFTAKKVANARDNIAKYAWAQSYRNQVVNYAAPWLSMSDEQIWQLPVEQTVPRSIYVHKTAGCPIHGSALIDQYGVYGWKVDPVNKPWKVQCPIGGETWPTNDFAKYRDSGLDSHHVFQSANANRSLLYSTDASRSYGVDDGTGYVAPNGTRYSFIAYYAHWGVWQNLGRSWSQALVNLSEAYVLTGNAAYARKTAILLSRIADLLPTMDTNYWSSRGYEQGDGNSGRGLALGSIWDAALGSAIARAYDAIYPALANDPGLFTFLSAKASQYGLTPVGTPAAFASHIENHALTVLLNAIQARRIRANEGIHQRTYAEAAIALDNPTLTPSWLNWLQQPGTVYDGGGHLPTILVDYLDRDGGADEASPGYSAAWLEAIEPLGALLEDSPYAAGYSLTQYPNFRNQLSFPFWLQLLPTYYPHIGDESKTGNPGLAPGTDANRFASAFQRYGYPELARMAYALNGNSSAGLHGDIYEPAAATAGAIDDVIASQGAMPRGSMQLAGYGLAALSATAGGKDSATWIYSGRQNKHGHWDRLNLGLFAYGLDLMPDLGYPDFPNVDSPNYWGWQNNTVAHNTVVVDAKRQSTVRSGATKVFAGVSPIKVVEVDGNGVYSQAGTYQRSLIQVPAGNGFYMVDLFRVQGGADHLYSFHGGPGAVATAGLSLAGQSGGTYAGSNISFGQFYDGSCCTSYMGSGFQFLDNVSRDNAPAGAFQAEWKVIDQWKALTTTQDTRLKVWSVGDKPSSVAFADGHPPANKPGNPSTLRYMLERRTGASPLTSTFVHVIEPYVGAAKVTAVETFTPSPSVDAAGFRRIGLRIKLADGSVDTIIHGLQPADVTGNGFSYCGRGLVVREAGGNAKLVHLLGGTTAADDSGKLLVGEGVWSGTISDVNTSDPDHVRLTIDPAPSGRGWRGRYLRVNHAGAHNAFYRILDFTVLGGVAEVDLGRVNLVRGYVNPNDYAQGLMRDVVAGDTIEVQADAFRDVSVTATPTPTPIDDPTLPPDPTPGDEAIDPITDSTTTVTDTTSTPAKSTGSKRATGASRLLKSWAGLMGCQSGGATGLANYAAWMLIPLAMRMRRK